MTSPGEKSTEQAQRVALIVGTSGRLLEGLALRLAHAGTAVALAEPHDNNALIAPQSEIDNLAERLRATGEDCLTGQFTTRDPSSLQTFLDIVTDRVGAPSLVVTLPTPVDPVAAATMTDTQWADAVELSLNACYCAIRSVLSRMTDQRGGRIVAVVGQEARRGMALAAHVAAAQWAIVGLAKSAALEAAQQNIAVNVVSMGPIDDPGAESEAGYLQALMRAGSDSAPSRDTAIEALRTVHPTGHAHVPIDAVLDAIDFLLARPDTAFTGSVIDISQGLAALNTA